MFYIYKITNTTNNKVYIGLTTIDVDTRWKNHIRASKRKNNHLYISMRKYGVGAFKIEVIDETDDVAKLGELERKYIKECDSTNPDKGYNVTRGGERNQLDGNPRAKLTVEDVEKIRIIYSECKVGAKKCWEMYKDKISFDAFEKIYEGTTWKSIMPEVYTESNKYKHKHMDSKRMSGEKMTCSQVVSLGRYPYTGRLGLLSADDRRIITETMETIHISELAERDFAEISDGQRQRVLLARAICQEPEIMILDEPTSYLDIRHKLDFLDLLRMLVREKKVGVIMSLHELELAHMIADRVICISAGGEIAGIGTAEEVFRDDVISELYGIKRGRLTDLYRNFLESVADYHG